MRIGACVSNSIENARLAKEAGFDFVESHCQNIVKMTEEELDAFKNLGIPVYSANCFIGMRVVGPDRDEKAIAEYTAELFKRAKYLDIKLLVFGSSGARRTEGELSVSDAREQIVDFLTKHVVPYCNETGIMVAVEPLRKEECNVINTVAQGIDIAKKVDSPFVKVLADLKHMVSGDDPVSVIPEYKDWVIHGHTSNPYPAPELGKKRTYPTVNDEFKQDEFFNALAEAGVSHCAIEADVIDFKTDIVNSYEVLKVYKEI